VVERYVYDPYGNCTIYDDDWSATRASSSCAWTVLFAGYWRDAESGPSAAKGLMPSDDVLSPLGIIIFERLAVTAPGRYANSDSHRHVLRIVSGMQVGAQ